MSNENFLKENEDFLNIKGEYVSLFKHAKNYSKAIIREISKLNSSPNFSMESLVELEEKLNSLNQENKGNPYIYRDNEITIEYTIDDMKYFLGENRKSKENIVKFCESFLEKLESEEKSLILSPEDMLKCLQELNQIKKEDPMGEKAKKESKKKENVAAEKVSEEIKENTSETLKEELVESQEKIEMTNEKGDNMKKDDVKEEQNIYNHMSGFYGCEKTAEKSEAKEAKKEAKSKAKKGRGSYFLKVGAVFVGAALLTGAGLWAYNRFANGEINTDSTE